ncbi:hypothetical protein [Metaclostridioides mangenotii]|nr:hypothetical protein [Clostridioides mangenotii]
MEQNIEFERCIDFLTRIIEKYGDELLQEQREEINNDIEIEN